MQVRSEPSARRSCAWHNFHFYRSAALGRNQTAARTRSPVANKVTSWQRMVRFFSPMLCTRSGSLRPRITMVPLGWFRRCPGNRKWKRKCTRISRDARKWHACTRTGLDVSQCRFSLHLRASLLICVHLRFHLLALPRTAHARDWRSNAKPTYGAAMKLWCALDRSTGTHRLVGKVPVRRRIIIAVLFSPGNFWRKPSSKSAGSRVVSGNSPRVAVLRRVGSADSMTYRISRAAAGPTASSWVAVLPREAFLYCIARQRGLAEHRCMATRTGFTFHLPWLRIIRPPFRERRMPGSH